MLLLSLFLNPIFGVFALLTTNIHKISLRNVKLIALTTSILNFFISLILFMMFDSSTNQFQFVQENSNYFEINLGVDGLSIYFVVRPFLRFGKSNVVRGFRLPNSGNTLKLFLPDYYKLIMSDYNLRIISGHNNYHGKVINKKISENEAGYRGSKSTAGFDTGQFKPAVVKEQRVDGSCFLNKKLRYTLMDCENSYQTKILSKPFKFYTSITLLMAIHLHRFVRNIVNPSILPNSLIQEKILPGFVNKSFMSTLPSASGLDPWFITGFSDAEASFIIHIRELPRNKSGWRQLNFLSKRSKFNTSIALPLLMTSSFSCFVRNKVNAKHLSGFVNKSFMSTLNSSVLDPWFITGFSDGEASFYINTIKDKEFKIGWRIRLNFEIHIHKKDQVLLEEVQKFFAVGVIYKKQDNTISYIVNSIKNLSVIIKHFDKYLLHTKKRADFELWKKAFDLIQNKEHLTMEGLHKIVAIRATLNKGLTDELKSAFPSIIPANRPDFNQTSILDPNWLAGFTSAEGCFFIKTYKSESRTHGILISLVFQVTQHKRDDELLKTFIKYLDCGNVYKDKDAVHFRVEKFTDIDKKIMPLFSLNLIHGIKYLDYTDWCKAVILVRNKSHLTKKGIEQLLEIKAGMNTGRDC